MKQKILDAFKALGFGMEELDETAYGFHYEGKSYLFLPNAEDENFLNIALPCVLEADDVDETVFNEAMEKMNSTLKYVKTYRAFGGMTIFYERELFGDEDLERVISRMILHLESGLYFLHRNLIGSTSDGDASEVDDSDDSETTENSDDVAA